jgi:3-hydroxy-9,10-secoandrosta-1,3,5(10)-triene-9,17-dione monooxygenase reductase component
MSGFDSARFRQVLGHFPTGVTVVTADPGAHPVGITIGSFTSVSLDPPLVGFLPGKASDSWPEIERAGSFCVNVLAEDQADLCWSFAKESDDKFVDVPWRPAPSGSPILPNVLAWMDCSVHDVVDAGDHWFVVGRVQALEAEREHVPLLFFRGRLGGFHHS